MPTRAKETGPIIDRHPLGPKMAFHARLIRCMCPLIGRERPEDNPPDDWSKCVASRRESPSPSANGAVTGQGRRDLLSAGEGEGALGEGEDRPREAGRRGAAGAEEAALLALVAVGAVELERDVGHVAEVRGEPGNPGRE